VFVTAVTLASKFTRPVVVSSRSRAGTVTSGCGSFVLVNDEGWILSAAHVFEPISVLKEHQKAHAEYVDKSAKIDARMDLKATKKKHLISKLGFNSDWLSSVSFWWAEDGLKFREVHMNLLADIALTKLENFKAQPDTVFPKFGDPASDLPPGRSLCKLGFPFHSIGATYDDVNQMFRFVPGSLPIPRFPLDGILTRYRLLRNPVDNTEAKFLEMSTPGLRGQSGGPIFDAHGIIWGIQVRTESLALGFQPEVTDHGKKVAEHQFLNVGVGAYVSEIIALLKLYNVKYDVAT
jgi:Trypsin-like peptidase domain